MGGRGWEIMYGERESLAIEMRVGKKIKKIKSTNNDWGKEK